MVLISSAPQATNSAAIEISVPLRGLWFLSQLDIYLEGYTPTEFPSPCGDYGSYLTGCGNPSYRVPFPIPSPCGDYGSYRLAHAAGYQNFDN